MVAPALQSEGKSLQREQAVGMGATGAAAPAPVDQPAGTLSNGVNADQILETVSSN
jgi:hypothetical protein